MPPPTSAQVWSLGSSVSGGLSNYYGIIDHVVISANNNLSDAEIKARYEAATNRYFLGIESYTAPTPPPANVTGGNVTVTVNVTGLSNNALLFVVILILIIAILLFLTSR
jgi:PKD repeat protein